MFFSSQLLNTLFAIRAARPRKKSSATKNHEFEKKKTAYFGRGGIFPFVLTTQMLQNSTWTPDHQHPEQKRLIRKREGHVCFHRTFEINRCRRCSRKVERRVRRA